MACPGVLEAVRRRIHGGSVAQQVPVRVLGPVAGHVRAQLSDVFERHVPDGPLVRHLLVHRAGDLRPGAGVHDLFLSDRRPVPGRPERVPLQGLRISA